MAKSCTEFVRRCHHCQRFKHRTRKMGKHSMIEEPTIFGQDYREIQRGRYDRSRDAWSDSEIQAGDKVWLSSKDLSLPINAVRGQSKLTENWYGPYEVKGYVGPQTVTLKLPRGLRSWAWPARVTLWWA